MNYTRTSIARPNNYGNTQDSDRELSINSSASEYEESDSDMSQNSGATDGSITKILEGNRNKYIISAKVGKSKKQVTKRMKEKTKTEGKLMANDSGFSDHQQRVIKQVKRGSIINCGNKIYEVTFIAITPYGSEKVSVWGKRKKLRTMETLAQLT